MGCDIHQRTWVWSTVEKKYVSPDEIGNCYKDSDSTFEELFPGRNYDVFGVLAGVRGDRFKLSCYLPYNRPECLKLSKTFKKYIGENNFHTFTWYYAKDLYKGLDELITKLEGLQQKYKKLKKRYPKNWYNHWFDDIDPESDDYDDDRAIFTNDEESDTWLLANLKQIRNKVKKYFTPEGWYHEKFIDMDKTLILFYFDS